MAKKSKMVPNKKLSEYTDEELRDYIEEISKRILRLMDETHRLGDFREELANELIARKKFRL